MLMADDKRIIDAVSEWVDPDIAGHHVLDDYNQVIPMQIELCSEFNPDEVPSTDGYRHKASFEEIEFYSKSNHTLLTIDEKSTIEINLGNGTAKGYVAREHLESPWSLRHRIFYLPVLEILRHNGAYYIHAGCVCRDGKCVLLCGGSGQGKSTLTYLLARSRFSYMSDDAVFLLRDAEDLEIFSFPEKIKLDRKSCSNFPEFDRYRDTSGKVEIPLRETNIKDVTVAGKPDALILPEISGSEKSELVPISNSEALLVLIRQSITLTDEDKIEDQLDLLKQLCEGSRSFKLKFGNNFEGLPELIDEVLFT